MDLLFCCWPTRCIFFCLVVKLVYFLRTSFKLISKKNLFNIHVVWSQRWLSRLEHLPCMRMVGYSNHSRDIPDSLNVSVWLFVWLWSKTSVCLNGGIEPWSFAYKAIALPLSHRGGKQVLTGPRKTFGKIWVSRVLVDDHYKRIPRVTVYVRDTIKNPHGSMTMSADDMSKFVAIYWWRLHLNEQC